MKKFFSILVTLVLTSALAHAAFDFSYTYLGITLGYSFVEGTTNEVMVTPELSSYTTRTSNATGTFYYSTDYAQDGVSFPANKNVVIPDTVEYNGEKFAVTGIGANAFFATNYTTSSSGSSSKKMIKSIIIPRTVKRIEERAFYGAFQAYSSSNTEHYVTIPENVEYIGAQAFAGNNLNITWLAKACTMDSTAFEYNVIQDLTFGTMVEEVPAYLFANNTNITEITLPYNVRKIGNYAFYFCSKLRRIGMGESLQEIGAYAFQECTALNEIVCAATVPPVAAPHAFENVPINATMEVPCGSVNAYATADEWKYFWYYTETILYKATVLVEDDQQGSASVEYDCAQATFRAAPNEGFKFKEWSNGRTDNPLTLAMTGNIELTATFEAVQSPQGTEETLIQNSPVKFLQNGQLLIEKNGVLYNAQGAVVK